MTFDADELENGACAATGLDNFGSPYYRDGLERIVDALNTEASLNDIGRVIQHATISNALIQRLKIEDTYRQHPEIDDEVVGGPVFVIGLPRTGTTALSQLVAADPQFRSLRMWESQAPTPPPEAATQHSDPRIEQAEAGLKMLDDMFPLMKTMHNSEATAATECQDLMGMSFRTFHFDGVVRSPGYLAWLMDCDMRETYTFHRRVLKLLQWHCPPVLWHLKTPVHMFALDALVESYPNARFLWSHRDPAKVMGSVCSLIQYVRSWSSDRNDPKELGAEQVDSWVEAVRRAMDFRARMGSEGSQERFADVSFADLQTDPIGTLQASYERLGLSFTDATADSVKQWAQGHKPGARGAHDYDLADYGLTSEGVRERFADYLAAYDATA
jgi:Sulfotransferase family